VLGAERQKPNPVATLPRVSFTQLDVEFDGDRHDKSQWGEASLRFVGSGNVLYFNLTVLLRALGLARLADSERARAVA
jgi:hypothetical protein